MMNSINEKPRVQCSYFLESLTGNEEISDKESMAEKFNSLTVSL